MKQSMHVIVAAIVILLGAVGCLFAQPAPDTLWTRTYGGSHNDHARSVQQTADGGYIVAGDTRSFGAGGWDFYLVKTNNQGDTLWTRTYGGSSGDWARYVQQTADGGYIVAGYTASFGAGNEDFYLIRADSQGDTLWTRTYGGSNYEEAWSAQQTADGGYVVAGWTSSYGAGAYDFYVVKTDPHGDTLWTRTYGGSSYDWAFSVKQTADGGYVVAGYTESFGAGVQDFYVVKADGQGDTLWTRTYGGSSGDYAYSVQQTADRGHVVAGNTYSYGVGTPNYANFYLVKTGPDGLEAPDRLVILIQDENAVLSWPPTGAPSYNIYGATDPFILGSLLTTVSDTAWIDPDFALRPSRYFYYVTAASP